MPPLSTWWNLSSTKRKWKTVFSQKNWDLTDFYKSKLSFLMKMLNDLTVIMNISIRADPLKCTLKDGKTWFSKFHDFLKIIVSGKITGWWFQNGFWYPKNIREAYLECVYIIIIMYYYFIIRNNMNIITKHNLILQKKIIHIYTSYKQSQLHSNSFCILYQIY